VRFRIFSFLTSILFFSNAISAQPYIWFMGSTIDSENLSGDRVVVVNSATDEVITPSGGWDFTDNSPGADPFIPAFSPDSDHVYLITGSDVDAGQNDGRLYVFETRSLISQWTAGGNPDASIELIDEVVLSSNGLGGSEPIGLSVDHTTGKVIVSDAEALAIRIYQPMPDHTLSEVADFNVGIPGSAWTNGDGTRAYVPSITPIGQILNVIDLSTEIPQILTTHPIPAPVPQSDAFLQFQFVSCGFPMPAEASIFNTPSSAYNTVDDSVLTIFSGYLGFGLRFQTPFSPLRLNVFINEPSNIYQLDTAANNGFGELLNQGDPILVHDPANDDSISNQSVLFPPTVHSYNFDNPDNQLNLTTTHIGGSLAMQENNDFEDLLVFDNDTNLLFPTVGQLSNENGNMYLGSIAFAQVGSINPSDFVSYNPICDTSLLYAYQPPSDGMPLGSPGTFLLEVDSINRSASFVVGQEGSKMFGAASDNLLISRLDSNAISDRNSIYFSFRLDSPSIQITEVDLGLLSGALAVQQEPPVIEPGFPELWLIQ